MDFCKNIPISSDCPQEQTLCHPCSSVAGSSGILDDLFSAQNTEEDLSLEWLSIFVEDCFSGQGSCLPTSTPLSVPLPLPTTSKSTKQDSTGDLQKNPEVSTTLQEKEKFLVPGKARSKRKRVTTPKFKNPFCTWSRYQHPQLKSQQFQVSNSDPPLLKQAYWLADSELIVTKKECEADGHQLSTEEEEAEEVGITMSLVSGDKDSDVGQQPVPRRCSHCLSQKTPQWRAGPLGPKTLCNACGVRYKSGRLLPEYRPAKSPTFVSYLHSNSHKKVMEMRMALDQPSSSIPSSK